LETAPQVFVRALNPAGFGPSDNIVHPDENLVRFFFRDERPAQHHALQSSHPVHLIVTLLSRPIPLCLLGIFGRLDRGRRQDRLFSAASQRHRRCVPAETDERARNGHARIRPADRRRNESRTRDGGRRPACFGIERAGRVRVDRDRDHSRLERVRRTGAANAPHHKFDLGCAIGSRRMSFAA
jgi:hypothetical protein